MKRSAVIVFAMLMIPAAMAFSAEKMMDLHL